VVYLKLLFSYSPEERDKSWEKFRRDNNKFSRSSN